MYFALLFSIILATGLVLHGMASLVALVVWRVSRHHLDSIPSRNAAGFLIALRFFPLVITLFSLAAFVVPAFFAYEPRATIEPLSLTLLSLAGLTAIVLSGSVSRCISALLQSRRVMRRWLSKAQSFSEQPGSRIYICRTACPVIAAMGVLRTRIFVSDSIVASLSPDELRAALAHESVHARNFDIAKKMLFHLAPAFLPGIDLLRPVSEHWARTCELLADEDSVAARPHDTLHLASALVKVVRLAQASDLPTLSAALTRSGELLLSHRIRRLVELSEDPSRMAHNHPQNHLANHLIDKRKALLHGCCLALILIVAYPHALSGTHELLELLVRV